MNGLVLIDKPGGWTSHDVVNRWRKVARTKRAGHLGTLDPMATGLLVLVTGTATRLAQFFGQQEKTYEAEVRLGWISDTYDADGAVEQTAVPPPHEDEIQNALLTFQGKLQQVPPPISAKKINGIAAYKLARKNKPVNLAPVEVDIKQLDMIRIAGGVVQFRVRCSAGTYIRSIAHDLGTMLGCGGILSALRRTASGDFSIGQARTLDQLQDLANQENLATAVVPASELLPEFPSVHCDELVESQIRQGREFRTSPFVVGPGAPLVKAISSSGELIAIGQLKFANLYHPMLVL
jgi:tRNA pseudouridine55 synthase